MSVTNPAYDWFITLIPVESPLQAYLARSTRNPSTRYAMNYFSKVLTNTTNTNGVSSSVCLY